MEGGNRREKEKTDSCGMHCVKITWQGGRVSSFSDGLRGKRRRIQKCGSVGQERVLAEGIRFRESFSLDEENSGGGVH